MTRGEHGDGAGLPTLPARARRSIPQPDVGRYRIEALIGRGGMATVHRAYDSARGHHVALKRLEVLETRSAATREASTADLLTVRDAMRVANNHRTRLIELFQREYQTLAQLAHPRIVEVYEYGLYEDRPYYTMELLEGDDLGKLRELPWQQVCSILCDVASALTLLHARRLLHRDVSPRNVYCSSDGRAKLLDFGVMTTIGDCGFVVGTPAFAAPEVLQKERLDSRCDLFSLGALGYALLTRRPPYPARNFIELAEAQRTPPVAPALLLPGIPKALDSLIMQLIQLDRAARPGSAVEVVERLRALAGHEHDAGHAVSSAYLSAPTLVARSSALTAIRRRALRTRRAYGASVLVAAESGVGRSRFLDACALEGKLAGSLVLRADPASSGGVEYGAVRALLLQLHAALAESERRARPLPDEVRDRLLPGLSWLQSLSAQPGLPLPSLPGSGGSELARAIHDYLVRTAGDRALMILVDDFERVDVHSIALIASLSRAAASCKLVLVAAYTSNAPSLPETALKVLSEYSHRLVLAPLAAAETAALLRSAFGDVPNLQLLADRLHALSGGKPSLCVELARHLIAQRVIRYEAGGFVLPDRLASEDFPKGLEQVLQARFARLSNDARELGALIALCAGAPLRVEQCMRVAHADDPAQAQRVFAELVDADMLLVRAERVNMRQRAFGTALLAGVSARQKQELHRRAAALLRENPGLSVHAAEHYQLADQPAEALDLLSAAAESDALFQEWFAGLDELLARAVDACAVLGRPPRQAFLLRRARVRHRLYHVEPGDRLELIAFARQLELLTGLTQFSQLDPALDPRERMLSALRMAQVAYEQTPERERIYAPIEALTELATYTTSLASYAVSTFDSDLQNQVPSLEPFAALSPAIALTHKVCLALRDLAQGYHDEYYAKIEDLLVQLDRPDRNGLSESAHLRTRAGLVYAMGMGDATLGRPEAFERARELDALPQSQDRAWRVRQLVNMYRGDPHNAEKCRREVEWLMLRDDVRQSYRDTSMEVECMCYARSDDVLGLRRTLPRVERMAERFAGWQPLFWFAQGELEYLRGRFDEALACSERALCLVQPARQSLWSHAEALRVRALVGLGRAEEARSYGLTALEQVTRHRLEFVAGGLMGALADAHSALGEHHAAIALLERSFVRIVRHRVSGLYRGLWHEQRARLALRVGDVPGFWRDYEACAQHYGSALDSPFAQRLASLLAEEQSLHSHALPVRAHSKRAPDAVRERSRGELDACETSEARAACGLAWFVELTAAQCGHLFGVRGDQLVLLASLSASSAGLLEKLQAQLRGGTLEVANQTQSLGQQAGEPGGLPCELHSDNGVRYQSWAITIQQEAAEPIVAVAAISGHDQAVSGDALDLLEMLGESLYAHADVTGFSEAS